MNALVQGRQLAKSKVDSSVCFFVRLCVSLFVIGTLAICVGCGGGGGSNPPTGATLSSIAVTPANPSIAAGATQQFKATGTYSDGTTKDLSSSAAWSSSNTSVATVSAAGLATGVSAGQSSISATVSGVQ